GRWRKSRPGGHERRAVGSRAEEQGDVFELEGPIVDEGVLETGARGQAKQIVTVGADVLCAVVDGSDGGALSEQYRRVGLGEAPGKASGGVQQCAVPCGPTPGACGGQRVEPVRDVLSA